MCVLGELFRFAVILELNDRSLLSREDVLDGLHARDIFYLAAGFGDKLHTETLGTVEVFSVASDGTGIGDHLSAYAGTAKMRLNIKKWAVRFVRQRVFLNFVLQMGF